MKTLLTIICSLAIISGTRTALRAQDGSPERVTVPWSDPSRPGKLQVNLFNGNITVKAYNGKDVIIESKQGADNRPAGRGGLRGNRGGRGGRGGRGAAGQATTPDETAGLKRIASNSSGVTIEESNNVASVTSSPFSACCRDLEIQVPAKTNLNLTSMNGNIIVEGVEGEIEATNMSGPVTLNNVAGSVVAHSMNGKVLASLRQVTANKMMSFTSMNGNVDVTLPPTTKANLEMHTNGGEIYSNFDVQNRPAVKRPSLETRTERGTIHVDIDNATSAAINGGGPEFDFHTFGGNIFIRKGK